jgi:hypothetical protein
MQFNNVYRMSRHAHRTYTHAHTFESVHAPFPRALVVLEGQLARLLLLLGGGEQDRGLPFVVVVRGGWLRRRRLRSTSTRRHAARQRITRAPHTLVYGTHATHRLLKGPAAAAAALERTARAAFLGRAARGTKAWARESRTSVSAATRRKARMVVVVVLVVGFGGSVCVC